MKCSSVTNCVYHRGAENKVNCYSEGVLWVNLNCFLVPSHPLPSPSQNALEDKVRGSSPRLLFQWGLRRKREQGNTIEMHPTFSIDAASVRWQVI